MKHICSQTECNFWIHTNCHGSCVSISSSISQYLFSLYTLFKFVDMFLLHLCVKKSFDSTLIIVKVPFQFPFPSLTGNHLSLLQLLNPSNLTTLVVSCKSASFAVLKSLWFFNSGQDLLIFSIVLAESKSSNTFEFKLSLDFSGVSFSAFDWLFVSSLIFSVFLSLLYMIFFVLIIRNYNIFSFLFMSKIITSGICKMKSSFDVTSISGRLSFI